MAGPLKRFRCKVSGLEFALLTLQQNEIGH